MTQRLNTKARQQAAWQTVLSLLLMALLLSMAGCASSPQYIQANPKVSDDLPESGSGQPVTLTVIDGRDSDVLGSRSGAVMGTDTITLPTADVLPELESQAEYALRQMGFTPADDRDAQRPRLTLTLKRLDYAHGNSQPLLGEAELEAVFEAEAQNGSESYVGRYTSRRNQSYALRPNQEDNTQMINELLSDGLDRAFGDPAMGQLLAR
ncbi:MULTISPECIES: YajG family lipoprotein [Halomonadaceae]|uniref:Putative lipoprotein n=1 Tax=Onishia taeanensis TaxID=284577 RepID=A0A328Y163_9GAMM|nr:MULTISPECIES: YajG family lipoprotein [Halomonas]RAR62064.1 putative lipoprotein [Halomonas taeanensis]